MSRYSSTAWLHTAEIERRRDLANVATWAWSCGDTLTVTTLEVRKAWTGFMVGSLTNDMYRNIIVVGVQGMVLWNGG